LDHPLADPFQPASNMLPPIPRHGTIIGKGFHDQCHLLIKAQCGMSSVKTPRPQFLALDDKHSVIGCPTGTTCPSVACRCNGLPLQSGVFHLVSEPPQPLAVFYTEWTLSIRSDFFVMSQTCPTRGRSQIRPARGSVSWWVAIITDMFTMLHWSALSPGHMAIQSMI